MVSQFTATVANIEDLLIELDYEKAFKENLFVLDDIEFLTSYYYCIGYLRSIVQKAQNDNKTTIILSVETAEVIAHLVMLQKENDVFK